MPKVVDAKGSLCPKRSSSNGPAAFYWRGIDSTNRYQFSFASEFSFNLESLRNQIQLQIYSKNLFLVET